MGDQFVTSLRVNHVYDWRHLNPFMIENTRDVITRINFSLYEVRLIQNTSDLILQDQILFELVLGSISELFICFNTIYIIQSKHWNKF